MLICSVQAEPVSTIMCYCGGMQSLASQLESIIALCMGGVAQNFFEVPKYDRLPKECTFAKAFAVYNYKYKTFIAAL